MTTASASSSRQGKLYLFAGLGGAILALGAVSYWIALRGSSKGEPQVAIADVQGAPIDGPTVEPVAPATAAAPVAPATTGAADAQTPGSSAGARVGSVTASAAPATAAVSAPTLDPGSPQAQAAAAAAQPMAKAADGPSLADRKPNAKGALDLTFADVASYVYQFPDDATIKDLAAEKKKSEGKKFVHTTRIPEGIWALDGKKISMQGFMLPYEVVEGRIKSFVLIKNQMACCYGVMPMMNEWVFSTMAEGKTSDFYPDIPILVTGKLSVGEDTQEGTVVSLYRMEIEEVTPLKSGPSTKDFMAQGF